jgi:hypothetical protein
MPRWRTQVTLEEMIFTQTVESGGLLTVLRIQNINAGYPARVPWYKAKGPNGEHA